MTVITNPKPRMVLIQPNQRWAKNDVATTWDLPPTALCRLAACAKDVADMRVLDAQIEDLSRDAFAEQLVRMMPKYVGISMLTSEYSGVLDETVDLVREALPDCVILAGGVHVTVDWQATMKNANIDYACRGEGEEFLPEFLRWQEGIGEKPTIGLVERDGDNVIAQERAQVWDLTALPAPDYSLVDLPEYLVKQGRYGPNRYPELPGIGVTISRGCPFACTFCQVETIAGKKIRVPGPEKVVDEWEYLRDNYGLKSFTFFDDNVFASGKKIKSILREMIKRDLGLKWTVAGFPIFVMDDELLDLMAEAGCIGVNVAIESGNDRVLHEIIKKPIKDLKQIPAKIQQIKDRNMFVLANFIIGLPGETWEEIRETVHFAEYCGADYVKIFVAVPLKGTKLWDIAEDMGAIDPMMLENQAVDWRFSVVKSDDWTPLDVSILRAYEWDRINFQPNRIEKVAEIWGVSVNELEKIRRETRDTLHRQIADTYRKPSLPNVVGGEV